MPKAMIPILTLSILAAAAVGHGAPVDLKSALRGAVANQPLAEAARQEVAGARAAVGVARSGYLPRVTFGENFKATNEPAGSLFLSLNQERLVLHPTADPYNDPPSRRDFETRLQLEQSLYNPDVGFGLQRARKGYEAARAAALWSTERAAFAAFAAYLEVQQAQAALAWVESSRNEGESIVRLAETREKAGVGLKADTLRARVLLAEARRRALSAANDLALARRRLALAMGQADGAAEIARPLTLNDIPAPAAEPGVRADLQVARFEAEAARLGGRQARAAYLPRLGLQAAYAWHDPSLPLGTSAGSWQLGAGLSWELFDGWRRAAAVDQAVARQRSAELRAEETRRGIALQLEEARLRAAEAQLQLDSARQAMTEAEEGHRLLAQRYEAGLSDLSDLLGAQTALDQARFAAVAAEGRLLLARGNVHLQDGKFLQAMLPGEEVQP